MNVCRFARSHKNCNVNAHNSQTINNNQRFVTVLSDEREPTFFLFVTKQHFTRDAIR